MQPSASCTPRSQPQCTCALASLQQSGPVFLCAQGLQGQLQHLDVGVLQWGGCSLGPDTTHLQGFLPPVGPTSMWSWIWESKEPPDCSEYRGCPNGIPGLGSGPQGHDALLGATLASEAGPMLTTDLSILLSPTQSMNPACTDFNLGLYLAKPLTWPYLDLNPDSHGPYVIGPPQQTSSGHAGFLSTDQSSPGIWLQTGLTVITSITWSPVIPELPEEGGSFRVAHSCYWGKKSEELFWGQ